MPSGGGDFDRAFDMLLTLGLAKIEVLISGPLSQPAHSLS